MQIRLRHDIVRSWKRVAAGETPEPDQMEVRAELLHHIPGRDNIDSSGMLAVIFRACVSCAAPAEASTAEIAAERIRGESAAICALDRQIDDLGRKLRGHALSLGFALPGDASGKATDEEVEDAKRNTLIRDLLLVADTFMANIPDGRLQALHRRAAELGVTP